MSEGPSGRHTGDRPEACALGRCAGGLRRCDRGSRLYGLDNSLCLGPSGARVVVFERAALGEGASARNAGFCTISPPFSATGLVGTEGHDGARLWLQWFRSAVDRVEALAEEISADSNAPIGFRRVGRMRLAETMAQASSLRHEAELQSRLGAPVRFIEEAALRERLPVGRALGAIVDDDSASLNPAALLDALSRAAQKCGAVVAEHCGVLRVADRGPDRIEVFHSRGATTARALVVATNGYTDNAFAPFRDFVLPVGSFIIVTDPIDPACRSATWIGERGVHQLSLPELLSRSSTIGGCCSGGGHPLRFRRTSTRAPNGSSRERGACWPPSL